MTRLSAQTTVVHGTREELLEKALDVALKFLSPPMPGDSRTVPDWFVAIAAVRADVEGNLDETIACMDEALALPDVEAGPANEVQVSYATGPEDIQADGHGTTRLTLHPPVHHPKLEALLEQARNAPPMTEAEWAEQRASMARGLMGD